MLNQEISDKIKTVTYKFLDGKSVTMPGRTMVTINGVKSQIDNVFEKCILKDRQLIKGCNASSLLILEDSEIHEASALSASILLSVVKANKAERAEGLLGETPFPSTQIDKFSYSPFTNVTTGDQILLDNTTGLVSKMHISAWERGMSKEDLETARTGALQGELVFDPFQIEPFAEYYFEGRPMIKVNLYKPPTWMYFEDRTRIVLSEDEIAGLECPLEIVEFMQHLFPDKLARDFVFSWMHFALVSRCETYLVLNGKKGAGKNLFCDVLLSKLVGVENYRLAPESILDSIFNSALDKTRMLVLDEINVNTERHLNKLKKYANKKQNIEKKGIDADTVVETFSSNVIMNNSISDMRLSWDERRFSVPDLTPIPLPRVWSEEKIDKFVGVLDDINVCRQFGFWVLHKAKKSNQTADTAFKGKRFYEIVFSSLAEWQKVILDLVFSADTDRISIKDLRREYKARTETTQHRFPAKMEKIEAFLDTYRHEGGHEIGSLVKEDGEYFVVPSDNYLKVKKVVTKNVDATGLL